MKYIINFNLYESVSRHKGDSVTVDKVYHQSNPIFRDTISKEGLKPMRGESYTMQSPSESELPAIFGYTGNINNYDSSYDDDIWLINTNKLDNEWFYDKQVGGTAVMTFDDIPRCCIDLVYKGSGDSL